MAFSRVSEQRTVYSTHDLIGAMAGIGFVVDAEPDTSANIEDTLVAASVRGMEDVRVLAMLVSWLDAHLARVNADRLIRETASFVETSILNPDLGLGTSLSMRPKPSFLAMPHVPSLSWLCLMSESDG